MALMSPRLRAEGFVHGFTTRPGDPPALGPTLFQASQVHGSGVLEVRPGDHPQALRGLEADALVARSPGHAVGVRVADCVPVLLADRETGHVAAVHAGWRGLLAGVLPAALGALAGGPRGALVASVGPHIGPCCFEVASEVATRLAEGSPPAVVWKRDGERPTVDLGALAEHQLRTHGVPLVERVNLCTRCHPALFFSYRRDGPLAGRMVGFVAVRAPTGPDHANARGWSRTP
ncbi:MAG: polyphenol oxidase family protein [Deltaproteobacteria bacterium]|nr:polyphenol oxidase family protein [Deltaproteobacteria bacterium]